MKLMINDLNDQAQGFKHQCFLYYMTLKWLRQWGSWLLPFLEHDLFLLKHTYLAPYWVLTDVKINRMYVYPFCLHIYVHGADKGNFLSSSFLFRNISKRNYFLENLIICQSWFKSSAWFSCLRKSRKLFCTNSQHETYQVQLL